MACCIALAMVIAFARGAWALIPMPRRKRKAPRQDFAPTAHRPAPVTPAASEQVRAIATVPSDATVAARS